MYTSIMESFLESIRALQYYVDSVELTNSIEMNDMEDLNSEYIMAMFMYIAKYLKINNCEFEDVEAFSDLSDEFPVHIKDKIIETVRRLSDVFVVSQDGKTGTFVGIPKKVKDEYQKLVVHRRQKDILYCGTLMLLVTYFENTISKILRTDFRKHPGRMSLENKTVAYSILEMSEDIQDVKNHLIDVEVNNLMYKSAEDWISYLKKNLKLDLNYVTEKLPELKEIICRRNIIVHNDGIVNNIYLSQVKENNIQKGDKITVSREYINDAINIIETIGTAIIIEIWIKECRKESDEFATIVSIIFDEFLIIERWQEAKVLYEICLRSNKLKQSDILLCQINRWQCFKWLDEFEDVRSEVEELDISAFSAQYKLGILALQDKFKEFFEVYDTQDEIGREELEEWPLFKNVRNCDEYQSKQQEDMEEIQEEERLNNTDKSQKDRVEV